MMDFQQAEIKFRSLTQQYNEQKITLQTYRELLKDLRVTDSRGQVWMPQERTGRWHVLKEGRWVPSQPSGDASGAPNARLKKLKRKKWAIFMGVGVLGVVGLCLLVILAAGLFFWLRPDIMPWITQKEDSPFELTTTDPLDGPQTSGETMEVVNAIHVPADSSRYTDEHGVSLVVPSEALEDASKKIVMSAYSLPREIGDEISEAFNIESLIYEVGVEGEMDGAGKAELAFPVQGDEAVLMVIINNEYYGFFDQTPENGVVKVHAHLGNMESGELTEAYYSELPEEEQSIRYVLLSPKAGIIQNEHNVQLAYSPSGGVSDNLTAFDFLNPSVNYQTNDPHDCSIQTYIKGQPKLRGCRTNPEQSVIVKWQGKHTMPSGKVSGVEFSQQEADNLINAAESIIDRFYNAGFTNAKIESQWFGYALTIVVAPTGDPSYSIHTGVLELPVSAARGISPDNPPEDLMHELAHWIQAKKYSFYRAAISSSRRWWLEVSAELMAFLIEPKHIDSNLNTYKKMGGFQKAPFAWAMFGEQDEYVHAHLVWVSFCDMTHICPLSQLSFTSAINKGEYPFHQPHVQKLLLDNLDDYARYLLNHPPQTSNLSAVTNVKMGLDGGSRVGELVNAGIGGDVNLKFNSHGNEQHFISGSDGPANTPSLTIDAQIEKGGVYPFTLTGSDFGKSSLPVALIIEPGPPFWLKLGDAEPVRYDGGQQYIIQPVSKTFGEEIVRMIVLGEDDTNQFQAQVALIDLQGDWMIRDPQLISFQHNCDDIIEDDEDREIFIRLINQLSHHLAARGSYVYRQEGAELSLVFEPEDGHSLSEVINIRVPPEDEDDDESFIPFQTTYAGKILLTPESLEWTMDMKMVRIKSDKNSHQILENRHLSGVQGWPVILIPTLLFLALPSGLWLSSKENPSRRRIFTLVIVINLISLACISEMMFQSMVKLDKIEYTMPIDHLPLEVGEEPIFRLFGDRIVTKITLTYEEIDPDTLEDGIENYGWDFDWIEDVETETKTCTLEVVTEGTVAMFHNGIFSDFNMFDEIDF
jgi:hypothetical protein